MMNRLHSGIIKKGKKNNGIKGQKSIKTFFISMNKKTILTKIFSFVVLCFYALLNRQILITAVIILTAVETQALQCPKCKKNFPDDFNIIIVRRMELN